MNSPPRMRIARDERLRGRDTIHRVFEVGKSARRGRVIARFVFDGARAVPLRIGVAATRKIGSAVLRNRSKRLLREAARSEGGACAAWLREHQCSADVMLIWAGPSDAAAMTLSDIALSVRDLFSLIVNAAPRTHEDDSPRAHPAL